jgi:hypothetical protein
MLSPKKQVEQLLGVLVVRENDVAGVVEGEAIGDDTFRPATQVRGAFEQGPVSVQVVGRRQPCRASPYDHGLVCFCC